MTTAPEGEPPVTVDGTGLLCVRLLLKLRSVLEALAPGTLVHVTTTDPAAPLDLPAWCDLTGHRYLGEVPGAYPPTHAVVVAEAPRPTRPGRPWHPM
jgi:TusA-related sulfurtransferase